MRKRIATQLIAASLLVTGCTIEGGVERTYTMQVDGNATSPAIDREIDADRIIPHLPLGPDAMGMPAPRMMSITPVGNVREGLIVLQDARPHSREAHGAPGVTTSRSVEIGEDEGGQDMLRSLTMHPVLLARVRFDCRRNVVTYLSYNAADGFAEPFAHSFMATPPRKRTLAGTMRKAACTGASMGLEMRPGRRRRT